MSFRVAGDWITVETRGNKQFTVQRNALCKMGYFLTLFSTAVGKKEGKESQRIMGTNSVYKIDCDDYSFELLIHLIIYGIHGINFNEIEPHTIWRLFSDALFLNIAPSYFKNVFYRGNRWHVEEIKLSRARLIKEGQPSSGEIYSAARKKPMFLVSAFVISSKIRYVRDYRFYLNGVKISDFLLSHRHETIEKALLIPIEGQHAMSHFSIDIASDEECENLEFTVVIRYHKMMSFETFARQKVK